MDFEKGMTYETEDKKLVTCFELTETFAFLCPIDLDGNLDLTKVDVYSTKEGVTPIETVEVADKNKEL
jgi:hypothetical protein